MPRQSLIGFFILFTFVVFCGGCCPEFSSVQVSASSSDSGRSFVAECGEEIHIQWDIANADSIESQYVKLLYPELNPYATYGFEPTENLPVEQREYTFTFKRPVMVQITVKCNDGETKRTVWLDFLAKNYYFNGRFACNHYLCNYPELGFGSEGEITIDFLDFVAFYDDVLGEPRIIDYLKPAGPGPFAMRTVVPAQEERDWCLEDIGEVCSFFKSERGCNYDYPEVNAIVYGGAFAKPGWSMAVLTDKGEIVETRQGSTEKVEPIFCTVLLSDLGEWTKEGVSEPRIIEIQLGNKSQGLALITDTRFLPVGVTGTTIGSFETAHIEYPFDAMPTIDGKLKGARVGFSISTEDGQFIEAPVTVDIPEASWYMPYLGDTADLSSLCGG